MPLQQDGVDLKVLWASGYAVDKEMRGRGIGKALMLGMQELDQTFAALGASAMSFPIFEKLGWDRAEAKRVVFVRRSLPIVRSKIQNPLAAGMCAKALDAVLWSRNLYLSRRRTLPAKYTVERVAQVPAEYLPREMYGRLSFPRTAAWMDWIDRSVERSSSRCWDYFVVHESSRPVGYFTISACLHKRASRWEYRDLWLATIKDWQAVDGTRQTNRVVAAMAINARHPGQVHRNSF